MNRLGPLATRLLCFAVVFGNIPVAILGYWLFVDPLYPIFSEDSQIRFEVNKDRITGYIDADKLRDCPGTIHMHILSETGEKYILPDTPATLPVGRSQAVHLREMPTLGPGKYRLIAEARYHCNPLRDTVVRLQDTAFTIHSASSPR